MKSKIVVWDLECKVDMYPSKGLFGGQKIDGKNAYLLAFNFKYHGETKVRGMSIHETEAFKKGEFWNDKELCQYAFDILTDPAITGWVGFYSSEFDVPLLNTRLQYWGLPTLPQMPHDDIYKIFKSRKCKLALSSYSLDYLCEFYHLPRKTKVDERTWLRAKAGHVPSIKIVSTYGKNDVDITDMLYGKAKSLAGSQLVIYDDNVDEDTKEPCTCIACGGPLKRDGVRRMAMGRQKDMYRCKDCHKPAYGRVYKI